MTGYDWPGNVRELEHAVERAVVVARGPYVEEMDLPDDVLGGRDMGRISIPVGTPLPEVENKLIDQALKAADGNVTEASRLLGISARTLYRRLAKKQ